MKRALRIVAVGSLWVFFAAGPLAAQDVQLRPMRPIYVDSLGEKIDAPEGVASDGSSRLVVADTGNRRLLLFDVTEDAISPTAELRLSQLPVPVRVRFDAGGDILALDGKSHRIARLASDGSFKGFVELAPASGRRAVVVKSLDVDDDGNLYVLDTAGSRIVVTDGAGSRQRTIAFAPEAEFLSDLTVNASGAVFALDSVGRRVFVARKGDGALVPLTESMDEDMAFPTAITADGSGYLYISDRSGGGIVVLGENGSFQGRHSSRGRSQGFLWYPSGLATDGDHLFVADRGNNRIQVFAITR
jgi:DNA-binding beta-propeller fold protein YncE